MRTMYLGAIILFMALLTTTSTIGQDKKDPETKAKGVLPKFYKSLGLTDDQKQTIYKVQTSYNAKIDALQKQVKDLRAEEAAAIEKTLTKSQMDRLLELKTESLKLDKDKDGKDKKDKDKASKDKTN